MSTPKPRMGIHNGMVIWHLDENGHFHWGSPADRAEVIAEYKKQFYARRVLVRRGKVRAVRNVRKVGKSQSR